MKMTSDFCIILTLDSMGNWWKKGPTVAPIPRKNRGAELTFQETGKHKTFMFAQSNTFIQIDGDIIQTFQLRFVR